MSKARDIASAAPAPSTVSATELGYVDGVTSAIQTQLDAKTAKSTLTTTGDIYYASSANTPARLGIGSTGNVLTVASGIPSWAAPAGGGKVLQVVTAQTTTSTTIATSTYTDTTLTATITPTSATSKILVMWTQSYSHYRGASKAAIGIKLLRNATVINDLGGIGFRTDFLDAGGATYIDRIVVSSAVYLDSPATTSATTYKTQGAVDLTSSGGTSTYQRDSFPSNIILMEIGA
jgi:hypothetical protein